MLLQEEKLAGASLLVLANKQDLPGALPLEDIERVSVFASLPVCCAVQFLELLGPGFAKSDLRDQTM